MLMPRTHRLLLASVLSSFLLAGTAQADDPIVIGAATASSGWMAPYDEGPTAAAQVAVDEINEHGGVLGSGPIQFTDFKDESVAFWVLKKPGGRDGEFVLAVG
jgi:hypothetical protein